MSVEPLCRVCGRLAEQVDHIVPVASGIDPFDESNLQSLCTPCHAAKSQRDARPARSNEHPEGVLP